MSRPLISVCILAYNRAALLPALLESVLAQDVPGVEWECVVAEDNSPERDAIRAVVEAFQRRAPGRIRYHENPRTLGYDGNFRQVIALAAGHYVFMMGNDDLVAEGALAAVADAIARHGEIGAILRAYTFFRDNPARPFQVNRYYPRECRFAAGEQAILACFRRLGALNGLVFHRDAAHAAATDRWDGTLWYQQWLAGNILARMDAVYIPTVLAHMRRGHGTDIGNAESEKGRFTPGRMETVEAQVKLVQGMFDVAQGVEEAQGIPIARAIRDDFARYSYHTLSYVAWMPRREFWRAYRAFGALGFDRSPWYHLWYWSLAVLGSKRMDWLVQTARRIIGHTPNLTPGARPY